MAAVAQGAPVSTFDLDIVYRQTDRNTKKLLIFLKSIDVYQRRSDDNVIEPDQRDLKGKGHLFLTTRFGPLDVLSVTEKGRGSKDPKDQYRLPILEETLHQMCEENEGFE